MIQMMRALGVSAVVVASCLGGQAVAQTKQLTLCWAAWDPANALVELSKDFTTKTGVQMKYEFVPWTSYADRFLNELNSKGKLCDLIIGDSQWIGGAAENGHYVKLNDFFKKEGITMDDFMPATVVGYYGPATIVGSDVEFVKDYDTLYPPGPGREVLERTCIACHGVNFYPLRQWDRAAWEAAVDMMSKRVGTDNPMDKQVPPGKLSPKDRELLIDYFVANFGPNSKKRALATEADMPLDEAALAKAMYVEYDMPAVNVPNAKPRGQNPYFDNEGNVWMTDRGIPNAIVKLDPRTATFRHFPLPGVVTPHGIVVDNNGLVWWGETVGFSFGRLDPESGRMDRFKIDPRGYVHGRGHDPIVDANQDIWLTVIVGNKLAKFEQKTEKITLYEPPTPSSYPYGLDKDKAGKIWISQFTQCRVAKFNPKSERHRWLFKTP